ncbi:MAG: restriction endonuclease [Saprospiraceae bacterium]|nr:restriction endonuclease [Saprospiraceae bacterium]
MDWKKYESIIFEIYKLAYPDTKIQYNQKILGRYSKTERQIDVLIEGRIAGRKFLLVFDGKYYSKKIDVKHVEEFISMIEDINAAQGILITSKGYTQAAINRAYYGPTEVELDILNFDELKDFQGFDGLTYSDEHGVIIPAPFGWIVDGTRREGSIATLYQRGKTYEDALGSGELIYVNIFNYDEEILGLEDVFKFHEIATKEFHPKASFEYFDAIKRADGRPTKIRKILREETRLHEYTGFVDFGEFCVFCVLLTPEELQHKNIRKLEYCIERMMPLKVNLDSLATVEIAKRERILANTASIEEKAEILISIAEIYRDIKAFAKAKEKYEESIQVFPECYGARLGLLEIGFKTENRNRLIEDLYNLSPGHRQICDDLVRLCLQYEEINFLEGFFEKKIQEHYGKHEELGNLYFSWGDLNYSIGRNLKALAYMKLARENFLKCFDLSHPALLAIEKVIKELEIKK